MSINDVVVSQLKMDDCSNCATCRYSIQILTGAEVNTEKLCPKLCNIARGPNPQGNIAQLRGIIFQC